MADRCRVPLWPGVGGLRARCPPTTPDCQQNHELSETPRTGVEAAPNDTCTQERPRQIRSPHPAVCYNQCLSRESCPGALHLQDFSLTLVSCIKTLRSPSFLEKSHYSYMSVMLRLREKVSCSPGLLDESVDILREQQSMDGDAQC
ncbi:hypothetical protein INR49_003611 [Caranx melampygus]|nr:hypothetical protein INR49_003611 [Caranx melampygus]